MSDQDSFISEVTDEVRRDRLFRLFKRYGWIAVLAVVVIVGGASVNEWRKAAARAEAEAAGDALVEALASQDPAARGAALEALSADDNAARAAVLALLRADTAVATGDTAAALAALEAIAGDTAAPAAFRDMATLKAAMLGSDALAPEERIARLNALTLGGGPFRLLAAEQVALAELELGRTDEAIARLRTIIADASVGQDLRRRASQLIVALGGSLTEQAG